VIAWLVERKSFVYLLVFCTVAFGTFTYAFLPREASPDVEIPLITVTTPYLGVSPEDIEALVTVPLENELAGVKDLKKMSSTSYEGVSVIFMEFEPEVDIQDALQRVRDRANRARSKLPADAEDTEINEINFSDFPILLVTLGGPVDELVLKDLGERLEDDIRRIPGVLDATLSGGREREIQIHVDPNRLSHYGLSLGDVIGAIRDENVNVPGGDVRTGDSNVLLRIPGEIVDPREIEGIAIKRVGDRPVFVRDVGRVVDGFAPRTTYARMNGQPAVSLAVSKRSGANIVELVDAVKVVVAQHAERWPAGVEHRFLGDQSKIVHDMIGELENGIILALILVVGVLLFFMGIRNSFFVALAVPLTMLMSFVVVDFFDMTLNMIVLFSLIMALGMLVDNAIVLVENIYRHVEEGKDLKTASIEGTREVAEAVTASTATTVAAFLPLVFWTGVMGQFMGFLPKTIVIVLVASLVVAVMMLPVFTARWMRPSKKTREVDASGESLGIVMRAYRNVLAWSIRRRYVSFAIGIATLIGTFVAYGELNHGTEFFAETEPNRAFVSVRAPLGTDLERTDAVVREVEAILAQEENVDVFVSEVGISGGQDPVQGSQNSPAAARITVDFLPDANVAKAGERIRVGRTSETVDRLRELVDLIPGADIRIEKENMGPPVGKPIDVRVTGDDYHRLGELAARVRREIEERIEGSVDLSDDYRVGRPEMRLRIDRGAAKRVGASTQAVANVVRTAVNGTVASTLREGEEEHDIVVQLAPEHRDDLQAILGLRIDGREDTSPDTFPVPIATVARFELAGGTGAIQHIDQDLVVSITGDVAEGYNANAVQGEVLEYLAEAEMPTGYHLELGGSNDEQIETGKFLAKAFAIGIALILVVLVYQFNRFDIPLIILMSVVLSLIGVLWGLVITGTPFGIMMTGLGVISLAGVVVNNAIVLLDYVEQLRSRGVEMVDALIQSGLTRFRPVLLTAITTVLGLVPMAVGVSIDFRVWPIKLIVGSASAEWWGPMAVAIIFGLFVSTVLTLVMVPTFYSIFEDLRRARARTGERIGSAWRRLRARRVSEPAE
jgi:multidrug efflux pump subunit AcrB